MIVEVDWLDERLVDWLDERLDRYAHVHSVLTQVKQAPKNKKASERGLTGNTYVLPLFLARVKRHLLCRMYKCFVRKIHY